jgi:hypothetical protein
LGASHLTFVSWREKSVRFVRFFNGSMVKGLARVWGDSLFLVERYFFLIPGLLLFAPAATSFPEMR